jgi:hypothetical protein
MQPSLESDKKAMEGYLRDKYSKVAATKKSLEESLTKILAL